MTAAGHALRLTARRTVAVRPGRAGFTLVELMAATALSSFVVAGAIFMFTNYRRSFEAQRQANHMRNNMRVAIDQIARDVRMAGYGVPIPPTDYPQWIDWVSGVTNSVSLVEGATPSDPDTLHVVAAFDRPVARLAFPAEAGDTTVTVGVNEGGAFDTVSRKLLFIGKQEMARVTQVSGNTLTISTDPNVAGVGLLNDYPADTPIELVKVVTYSWAFDPGTFPNVPHIRRDDNTGTLATDLQKIVAINVEDIQLTGQTNAVNVELTGRVSDSDSTYTHPTEGDHYRRMSLSSIVRPRNLGLN